MPRIAGVQGTGRARDVRRLAMPPFVDVAVKALGVNAQTDDRETRDAMSYGAFARVQATAARVHLDAEEGTATGIATRVR